MTDYVLGFLFCDEYEMVALLDIPAKEKHAGKLTGITGKVEDGESLDQAMSRLCATKTGISTEPEDWSPRVYLQGRSVSVYVYMAGLSRTADLFVNWYPADNLPALLVPNLRWLIPLCLDTDAAIDDVPGPGFPARIYVRL